MDVAKLIRYALREEYPASKYDVYHESIEQGFVEPCFSIRLLSQTMQEYPNGRTLLTPHFDVRYFPKNERRNEDCSAVAARLMLLLRALPGVRATDMEYEITDGVLHFFVSYPHFVREEIPQEQMETLDAEYTAGG